MPPVEAENAALVDRCRSLSFFSALSAETFDDILGCCHWFSLVGGRELYLEGAPADEFYVVLAGRLVVVRGVSGEGTAIGYIRSGEPVGEMALLSRSRRSASVFALRDTEVMALSRADFERLLERHADFATTLARLTLDRARHPQASFSRSAPRVFTLVASSPSLDMEGYARALATEIARYGKRVKRLSLDDGPPETLDFDLAERAHDVVLLTTRVEDTQAHRFILRHTDRFFVFARRDARPPRPFPLIAAEDHPGRRFRLIDFVSVHEGRDTGPIADWVEAVDASRVFHWSGPASVDRLARVIAGRSVGIILSGGGARAYAHIGAIRAMRQLGVPIDFACGASMGAIIAACVARGWDLDEIEMRIRDAFVCSNPLGDHVLPVVALTGGARVDERLAKHFGEGLIEDCEIPFFCVSSELTEGVARVHRRGSMRRALRASISLPGVLPPIVENGALLVDGAVINNFPTDMMSAEHRGVNIGIDVARRGTISAAPFANPPGFFRWIWRHGISAPPPIVTLLMRSATARHEITQMQHPADVLIEPDVPGVQLRSWRKYEAAVEDGYQSTLAVLRARWDCLAPIVDPALHADVA